MYLIKTSPPSKPTSNNSVGSHAKLSPSAASRWLNCPGSVKAVEGIPYQSSSYADEGSLAHKIAESCLVNRVDPLEYKDTQMGQDMAGYIAEYVEYINTLSGLHSYEQKVDFSAWVPGGFGTVDALIVSKDTIHVVDLKYGKGVQVYAEKNPQLMLYALGAFSEVEMLQEVKQVTLHIVQPRLDHIDTWTISTKDLLAWGEWARERALLALEDDAPRIPGDAQCRWCRAQGNCQALYDMTAKIVGNQFEDLGCADTGNMSETQIREILENASLIKSFLGAVESHVFGLLAEGKAFDGYKLVEGRSIRKWSSEKEAQKVLEDALGESAWERSLLSPAKAEKALGKKKTILDGMVFKPNGKPTLVPASDKRPAISESAAELFETVN